MAESVSRLPIGKAQHQLESTPSTQMEPPQPGSAFTVDSNVMKALPVPGTKVIRAQLYGESLWAKTAKVRVELPSGERDNYFLKVVTPGKTGQLMCEGEFESIMAIHAVSPAFVPKPLAWGRYVWDEPETYFVLAEFRDVGEQVSCFAFILILENEEMRNVRQAGVIQVGHEMLQRKQSL